MQATTVDGNIWSIYTECFYWPKYLVGNVRLNKFEEVCDVCAIRLGERTMFKRAMEGRTYFR